VLARFPGAEITAVRPVPASDAKLAEINARPLIDPACGTDPARIARDFARYGFRIWLMPDGALVIQDMSGRSRAPGAYLMQLFNDNADALGCWLEQGGAKNCLTLPEQTSLLRLSAEAQDDVGFDTAEAGPEP
jgi:hypothetical protein